MAACVWWIVVSSFVVAFSPTQSGRDAGGPIELIPEEIDDGSEDDAIKTTRDTTRFMTRVEENLATLIHHVDKLTRVVNKLDSRLENLHSRVDEIQQIQLNCSTSHQVKRLESNVALSLDDLDQRMDQIEKQMKLSSSSGIRTTIEDVNERAREIQRKLDSITFPQSSTDVLSRLDSVDGKLMDIHYDCKKKVEDYNQMSNLDFMQISDKLTTIQFLIHNKTTQIQNDVNVQAKSLSRMELTIDENTKVQFNSFQNVLDQIQTSCDARSSSNHCGSKFDSQIQSLNSKLNSFQSNVSKIIKDEVKKIRLNDAGSDRQCDLVVPHLMQMSETISYKYDQLKDVCQSGRDDDFLVSSVVDLKDKVDHLDKLSIDKFRDIDETTKMTQEKLNYMSSVLSLVDINQSEMTANFDGLSNKLNDVISKNKVIEEYLENRTSNSDNLKIDQSEVIHLLSKLDNKLSHSTSQISPELTRDSLSQTQNIFIEDVYNRVVTVSTQLTKLTTSIEKLSPPSNSHLSELLPRMEHLLEQNSLNLHDMKSTLLHHSLSPPTTDHEPLLRAISHTLDTVSSKLNSLTSESVDRLTHLLEENKKRGSDNFLPDVTTSTMIYAIYNRITSTNESTFNILKTVRDDIKTLLVQLHPLMDLPMQLYNLTLTSQSTLTQTSSVGDLDAFFWSRTSQVLDTVAEIQKRMEEKFTKLKNSLQTTVDEGMMEIVDILGQNKAWLQHTATAFVNQHSDNIIQVKESMTSLVSKGFENLHFMYQYLNGKLDKIHHIAAHNMEDCSDIQHSGHTTSGVYTIYPRNSKEMRVYCDMDSDDGGWTVIQRRGAQESQPRISFNRTWVDYKYGFGNLEHEFWLGNEFIHVLTHQNNYVLRIDMVYAEPDPRLPRYKLKFWHNLSNDTKLLHAQYSHFRLRSEHHNYTLLYGRYMGIHPYDGLERKKNKPFVTWDHAPDVNLEQCAKIQGGGWWYGNECFRYALNSKAKRYYWEDGSLYTGITWGGTADFAMLKSTEMKIIPLNVYQRTLTQTNKMERK